MKTNELNKLFTSAKYCVFEIHRLLYRADEIGTEELPENVKEGIEALKLYTERADDIIMWIKSVLPECDKRIEVSDDDCDNISIDALFASEPKCSDERAESKVDCGSFTEENVLLLLAERGVITTSLLQRYFSVGYGRAAKMIDSLFEKGYIVRDGYSNWIKSKTE